MIKIQIHICDLDQYFFVMTDSDIIDFSIVGIRCWENINLDRIWICRSTVFGSGMGSNLLENICIRVALGSGSGTADPLPPELDLDLEWGVLKSWNGSVSTDPAFRICTHVWW